MHDKEKLSMYVDITKITIIICWVSLIEFWLLKIFGGNFFEIMVKNENFLKFSDLLQNTWLKYVVSFITNAIYNYFMLGAVSQNLFFKGKRLIVVISIITSMWIVANFVNIDIIKMLYGYIAILVFGIIYQSGWKKTFGLIAIFLEFAFSTISMIIRNIDMNVSSNYLITMIMILDLYLMTMLYYLYSNLIKIRKEL